MSQTRISYFIIFSSFLFIILSLGVWQLNKSYIKEYNKKYFSQNLYNNPLKVNSLNYKFKSFQFIELEGFFLNNYTIFFEPRTYKGIRGFHKLVPFEVENKIIMVNRGFSEIKKINNFKNKQIIRGIIIKFPQSKYFELENDLNNNKWYTIEKNDISVFTGLKLEDYLMYEIIENTDEERIGVLPNTISEVNHLQYSITWFLLAIIMSVIFYLKTSKK